MGEQFKTIDEIKVETKIFKFINLRMMFIVIGFGVFGYVLSPLIYKPLALPFVIFNLLVGLLVSCKSPFNKGKLIYQSILLYIRNFFNRKIIYHAISGFENTEADMVKESRLMYTPLGSEE